MATFKEAFAAARKEKGAGKTFMHNGKSYSTDYAEEAKGTKPKAKPAGLNPKSGAARSTAGKVASLAKAEPRKTVSNPNATSVTGKVAPKMSMMEKAKADAKAAREKSQSANKPKPKAAAPAKDTSFSPLKRLGEFIAGGGMTGADKRKKAAEKAEKSRR
jgi:hypothetical protein